MSQTSGNVNLWYILRALRRRFLLFLLCILVVPAVAVGISLVQKKKYTASATLLFRDPQFDQKLFGNSYVQTQTDPTRIAATNLDLVTLQRVAALTARSLKISESEVASDVSASSVGQADLVSVQATATNPSFAAELANRYAAQFIAFRRDADRATIESAAPPLKRQIDSLPPSERSGSLGQSLEQRLSELSVLASLQTGNAELVQSAVVPGAPSSPKPVRNGAFGLFFGILLAIASVVLAEALDRRLRDPAEVEQTFERPLLGVLPESGSLPEADPGFVQVPETDRDAFRTLWVNLRYFSLSQEIRSVLVISPDRNDGKTTVAWGLGVAAASSGTRTLIIEADLRNPSFAKRFGVPGSAGLTSLLVGQVDHAQAIMRLQLPHSDDTSGSGRFLDVLPAGPRPPDPTELLQSGPMADLLRELEGQYDFIVVDTPPAAMVSDAVPLIGLVSGLIVVTRLGNTVRDHSLRLRRTLANLDAPVLGIVVNSISSDRAYGYQYGYGSSETTPRPPSRNNGAEPAVKGRSEESAPARVGTGAAEMRDEEWDQEGNHRSDVAAESASSRRRLPGWRR